MRRINLKTIQDFSLSLRGERAGVRVDINLSPSPSSPPTRGGERLACLNFIGNSRGLSVLFLVIAMMLMVAIGYVLSYLIPTKQKSVALTISSNQTLFLAQSGVEFAVRYATDQGWSTTLQLNGLDGMTKNLGNGSIILDYDELNDRLISRGQIPNVSERRIVVSNFTSFLPQAGLVLWTPVPCWRGGSNRDISLFIKNEGTSAIVLNRFSAVWITPPNNRQINTISMGGNQVFSGSYPGGSGVRNFTPAGNTQTVYPDQIMNVLIAWNLNISGQLPVTLSFYDAAGVEYSFALQPTGSCP